MKNFKLIALLLFISAISTNCRKGEEDPFISFYSREARFFGDWQQDVLKVSSKLQDTIIAIPRMHFAKNGGLKMHMRFDLDGNWAVYEQKGNWHFNANKDEVIITNLKDPSYNDFELFPKSFKIIGLRADVLHIIGSWTKDQETFEIDWLAKRSL